MKTTTSHDDFDKKANLTNKSHSEDIQGSASIKKSHHHLLKEHSRHKKHRNRLLIVLCILLAILTVVAILAAIRFYKIRTARNDASKSLQNAVNLNQASKSVQVIHSKLGFMLSYSKQILSANATILQNDEKTVIVTGDDLSKSDDYSIVNIYPNSAEQTTFLDSQSIKVTELQFSTNNRKNFFDLRKEQFGNLSDLDLTIKHFAPKADDKTTVELTKQEDVTIAGTNYKKLTYNITNTEFITTTNTTVQYITVQNSRPYVISIKNTNLADSAQLANLEAVLETVQYSKPDSDAKFVNLSLPGDIALAANTDTTSSHSEMQHHSTTNIVSSQTTKTITDLVNETALRVVAKNQPAVVRIGSIICMNFSILSPNKQVGFSASDACNAVAGSGAIVSSDGYISTNGHVVTDIPARVLQTYLVLSSNAKNFEPLKNYLKYLVSANIMSASQVDALVTALAKNDPTASEKILQSTLLIPPANFQVTKTTSQFGVQLSNEPLKVTINGSNLSFINTSTNVVAKLIGEDFDESSLQQEVADLSNSTSSDVALLKIEGNNFPVANLGTIDELKTASIVTAMGFPGFVDGGLTTKQTTTIPSATQGRVENIIFDSKTKQRKIIETTVPIAEGNSGGPGFAESGNIVGLATYALPSSDLESGVSKFSSGGILRDIADFKALLSKKNITLNTTSPTSQSWFAGIDAFAQAHYSKASQYFAESQKQYPANYLAAGLISTANSKVAAGQDLQETSNTTIYLVLGIIVVLIVAIIVVVVAIMHHHKKAKFIANTLPPTNDSAAVSQAMTGATQNTASPNNLPTQTTTGLDPMGSDKTVTFAPSASLQTQQPQPPQAPTTPPLPSNEQSLHPQQSQQELQQQNSPINIPPDPPNSAKPNDPKPNQLDN